MKFELEPGSMKYIIVSVGILIWLGLFIFTDVLDNISAEGVGGMFVNIAIIVIGLSIGYNLLKKYKEKEVKNGISR